MNPTNHDCWVLGDALLRALAGEAGMQHILCLHNNTSNKNCKEKH
jgi:hypothetical protein